MYVSSSTQIYAATSECPVYSISTEVTTKATNEKRKK